jgi:twitching motility protein PilT
MEQLNQYLQELVSTSSYELHLEPNKNPYVLNSGGKAELSKTPMVGTNISMMVFPLIPTDIKTELVNLPEIQFVHPHTLGDFDFVVKKTSAGFNVTVKPVLGVPKLESDQPAVSAQEPASYADDVPPQSPPAAMPMLEIESSSFEKEAAPLYELSDIQSPILEAEPISFEPTADDSLLSDVVSANDPQFQTVFSDTSNYEPPGRRDDFDFEPEAYVSPIETNSAAEPAPYEPAVDRRIGDRRKRDLMTTERMDSLFRQMAEIGSSDLHLSVSMPPMVRKDGKIQLLNTADQPLDENAMNELLHSIMPQKNREEFETRNDTDFAYEIEGLARFRCNIFRDRKGMGAVFRIIPVKMTTAEQLGLSKAILDLCDLSKGLVVVTGPTGSGKSTTLCAMVNNINMKREDHIITIEDPIEFVHDNIKCLVNQREVHNHTDSFKDALRAALREDPDILLVGEMRDLETISIAIETAETGHLVFGTLHTTTAASTVDRIIDQFPADRQQQIRVMLSESLKGVIAQTLLPKIGGGRVAALEVLIVTPAISNLIREGKTFQIPSAMQTGKQHGMIMLNDALFDLVQKKLVEPRDAYIKAVDKANFEHGAGLRSRCKSNAFTRSELNDHPSLLF